MIYLRFKTSANYILQRNKVCDWLLDHNIPYKYYLSAIGIESKEIAVLLLIKFDNLYEVDENGKAYSS